MKIFTLFVLIFIYVINIEYYSRKDKIICSSKIMPKDSIAGNSLYDSLLFVVVEKTIINDTISPDLLVKIIPKTESEYLSYYSLSFPDKQKNVNDAFIKLDDMIFKFACNGNINFFKSYIKMSEFVDGEYAETYFENIEIVISKRKEEFKEIYHSLNAECKKRLRPYYK